MPETSIKPPRRNLARLLLLPLIIVPFVPEIAIVATAALARLDGCTPSQNWPCVIATVPVSEVITLALRAKVSFIVEHVTDPKHQVAWLGALFLAIAIWLVVCYLVVMRGWVRVASRLVIGFLVTLVLAVLPYYGSWLAFADLISEDHCLPDDSGKGTPCRLFGGYIRGPGYSPADAVVQIIEWFVPGAVLALVLFTIYAIVVLVIAVRERKRAVAST